MSWWTKVLESKPLAELEWLFRWVGKYLQEPERTPAVFDSSASKTQLFFGFCFGVLSLKSQFTFSPSQQKKSHHFTLKGPNFASISLICERNSCSFSTQGALCENRIKEGDNLQLRLNERLSFRCYFFILSLWKLSTVKFASSSKNAWK